MIHDENGVLTDDELVVVRGLLRKTKCMSIYTKQTFPWI